MSVKFYNNDEGYVYNKRSGAITKKAPCIRREPFLYVLAIPFISKRSFLQLQ